MVEYPRATRKPLARSLAISLLLCAASLPAQEAPSSSSAPDVAVVSTAPPRETTTDTTEKLAAVPDSALVRAARQTKATKSVKSKSRISINDAAVKKSKGKLLVLGDSNPKRPATGDTQAKGDQIPKPDAKATERLQKARAEVSELEKELARLEEAYYTSDDPTSRDQIIEPRFNKTKEQLARAREELAAARDATEKDGSISQAGQ